MVEIPLWSTCGGCRVRIRRARCGTTARVRLTWRVCWCGGCRIGSLSDLLSEAVWKPFGMQRDGFWIAEGGREFAGSGVSATLRDYGRFGLLALRGGAGAVPAGWFAAATRPAFATGEDGRGYGMGWWTFADGSYAALGIFGQSVWIDPARDLVVVMLGAWPTATSVPLAASRGEIWRAAQASVDADAATDAESRRSSR